MHRQDIQCHACTDTAHMHARAHARARTHQVGDAAERMRGRVMSHKGGWIEVVEAVDVKVSVTPLEQAMDLVADSRQRLLAMARNAQALETAVAHDEAQRIRSRGSTAICSRQRGDSTDPAASKSVDVVLPCLGSQSSADVQSDGLVPRADPQNAHVGLQGPLRGGNPLEPDETHANISS